MASRSRCVKPSSPPLQTSTGIRCGGAASLAPAAPASDIAEIADRITKSIRVAVRISNRHRSAARTSSRGRKVGLADFIPQRSFCRRDEDQLPFLTPMSQFLFPGEGALPLSPVAGSASAIPRQRRSRERECARNAPPVPRSPMRMSRVLAMITPASVRAVRCDQPRRCACTRRRWAPAPLRAVEPKPRSENAPPETPAPLPLGRAPRSILALPSAWKKRGSAVRRRNWECIASGRDAYDATHALHNNAVLTIALAASGGSYRLSDPHVWYF